MVALAHHNLANAARARGDYAGARAEYAESLRIYRDYADRWALALLLEDIVVLAGLLDAPEHALELLGFADTLRRGCESPRGDELEAELETGLERAVALLDPAARAAARDLGRTLELGSGAQLALDFLVVVDSGERRYARNRGTAER
jgi:hypothetical protein